MIATRNAAFNVRFFRLQSSKGSKGALVSACNTNVRSHGAKLRSLLGLDLSMDLKNLFTKGSSPIGFSKKIDRAAACTLRMLTARPLSTQSRKKSITVLMSLRFLLLGSILDLYVFHTL